jgi:hypothetical protein
MGRCGGGAGGAARPPCHQMAVEGGIGDVELGVRVVVDQRWGGGRCGKATGAPPKPQVVGGFEGRPTLEEEDEEAVGDGDLYPNRRRWTRDMRW